MQGIEFFKPERLKLARNMYDGISKVALADMLNVSPSTITKWEDGTHYPQSEALDKLSEALHIPTHWFLKNLPDFGNPLFLNRAKKRVLKAPCDRSNAMLLNLAEVTIIASEWINLPEVDLIEVFSRSEALMINDGIIQNTAEKLRNHWGLGKAPISNLTKRLERAGIIIARFDIGYDDMDGTSAWINNRPYIFIAADKNNYFRSRFDLAHELGHIIMHKNLSHEDKKTMFDELERQAHFFASCFLLPTDVFALEVRRPSIESLMMLKKRWGISIAAMIYKLQDLKITSEESSSRLWRSYRYRGFSKLEPYDHDVEPEQPTLLKNVFELLLKEGGFAKSNIVDKFGLKKHLELLANLPQDFLNDDFGQIISIKNAISPSKTSRPTNFNEQSAIIPFVKS